MTDARPGVYTLDLLAKKQGIPLILGELIHRDRMALMGSRTKAKM